MTRSSSAALALGGTSSAVVELTTAGDGDRERGSVLRSRRGAASVAVERRAGERRDGERASVRAVTSAAGCSPADDVVLAGLDSGKLAGACLDVTDPEPLTKGHRLWKMPNVIITPHVAGRSAVTTERRAALLRENLRRFAAGEPLMNTVDKKLGY